MRKRENNKASVLCALVVLCSVACESFGNDASLWLHYGDSAQKFNTNGKREANIYLGFGSVEDIALDPVDGSVWIAAELDKYDEDGTSRHMISKWSSGGKLQGKVFDQPASQLAVDYLSGNCWVADSVDTGLLYELKPNLKTSGKSFRAWDVADTHSYVWDMVYSPFEEALLLQGYHYRISGDGFLFKQRGDGSEIFGFDDSVRVFNPVGFYPADGSCWLFDYYQHLKKIDAKGNELFQIKVDDEPIKTEINPIDGTCWVASRPYTGFTLKQYSPQGELLKTLHVRGADFTIDGFNEIIWLTYAGSGFTLIDFDGNVLNEFTNPGFVYYRMHADSGGFYTGYAAINHANSNTRLWADSEVVDIKPDARTGERAQWIVQHLENGYVHLINKKSKLLLRADNDGAGVLMDTIDSGKAQWELVDAGNGEVMLKNKRFGSLLSGKGGNALELLKPSNPGPNYCWNLLAH